MLAIVVSSYFFFRTNVQGVPVNVTWVFKNGSAYKFRAEEDLQGIFLRIKNARGKIIETIKKNGIPLEVKEIDKKDMKAYLVKFANDQDRAFLAVSYSKMKHSREYTVLEGTGETVNVIKEAEKIEKKEGDSNPSSGNAVVLHEEQSAAKEFFKGLAMALQGTFRALILPLIAGGALGMSATIILILLTGHFH